MRRFLSCWEVHESTTTAIMLFFFFFFFAVLFHNALFIYTRNIMSVDSKAQKLLDFSSNQTPLEVIMLSVVKGVVDMEWTDSSDVVNAAIENLIDGM